MLEKQLLHDTEDNENLVEHHYKLIFTIKSNQSHFLTPEELRKICNMRLEIAVLTLKANNNQFICTPGLMKEKFETDKLQLWNNHFFAITAIFTLIVWMQLLCPFEDILEFLFMTINLILRSSFYARMNPLLKLVINMLSNWNIWPYSCLHSDNHNNLKKGVFKRLLWKFCIWCSYTELNSPYQNKA